MFSKIEPHANPIIANFQLFTWLLFHPSAWCAYVNQIDPTLPPDFALADIPAHCQHNSILQRLRFLAFYVQPLVIGILIVFVLVSIHLVSWAISEQAIEYPNIVLGVTYGMILCLIGSMFSSFAISVPFGLMAGGISGLSVGILIGMTEQPQYIWGIVLGIFALSMAGSVTATLPYSNQKRTLAWQIGSFVVGIFVGIIVLLMVLAGGVIVLGKILSLVWLNKAHAITIGTIIAGGIMLGWFRKGWRWGLILGLLFGSIMAVLIIIKFGKLNDMETSVIRSLLSGPTNGMLYGMSITVLFALPYLIAKRIATVWAGVVAGLLSSSIIVSLIVLTNENVSWDIKQYLLIGCIVAFILGLAQKWWRAIVLYPFESALNLLLYQAQEKHPEQTAKLLQWHSAFWDEHQYLRLLGLETQLVLLYEQDPSAGQAAIIQLSGGTQSWAIQATQVEKNKRLLANCKNIHDIAKIHEELIIDDSLKENSADWLRQFFHSSQQVGTALSRRSNEEQRVELQAILNRLQGMLAVPQSPEMHSFRDIAISWLHIIEDYVNELQRIQKIPDPYIRGLPLNNGEATFVPRAEIERIEQLLLDNVCPTLLLYGQRRIGKTSLLKNLVSLLPNHIIMLFVDCQGTLTSHNNPVSFFYDLSRLMINVATKSYPDLTLPTISKEVLQSEPFSYFDEWLDHVEQAIGDKMLLLALDEFVMLDQAFQDGKLDPNAILGFFRNIIQHRQQIKLLFSGTHTFEELQHWATYLINVQTIHLSYLSDNEVQRLIERPVKNFPLRYLPEAKQRVMDLTHNQPALVQLLCGEIVQLKNTQTVDKRLTVQVEDVEAVSINILKLGRFFFADIEQNQVNKTGRKILRFMATSHQEGEIVSRDILLAQFPTDLAETLALLLRRELIEEVGNGEGYRFQVELVRRWFLL